MEIHKEKSLKIWP